MPRSGTLAPFHIDRRFNSGRRCPYAPGVTGFVSLVGAGPWDPELMTLAAVRRVSHADVIIADYLVNPLVFSHARADALIIQREAGPKTAQLQQARLNDLMVEHATSGAYVVRLKGGDPMMFGRGAEEASHLEAHGIGFEFVPGVSSPIAAPECAGIPVTHRDHTPSVSFVSGYEAYDKAGLQVAWDHLAQSAGTLVLMMSVKNCRENAARLIAAGRKPDTPAAIVRWGSRGIQQCVESRLDGIADAIDSAKIRPPAVLVVGDVVRARSELARRELRPLHGRRVAITRTCEAARELSSHLNLLGADVVSIPSSRFELRPHRDELAKALLNADQYDGIIFASARALEASCEALLANSADLRKFAHAKLVAVGQATARALRSRGVAADLVPQTAHSEGIVEALNASGWVSQRWLHPRADRSRASLGTGISENGGQYLPVTAYSAHGEPITEIQLRSIDSEGLDAVCFASGRSARHHFDALAAHWGEEPTRTYLNARILVALGPVTAQAMTDLGLQVRATATDASNAGMVEALCSSMPAPANTTGRAVIPPLYHRN